jgi:hypothetical protein
VLGTQAAGAEVHPFRLTVYGDGDGVDIGRPLPIGVALGVAYIMAEHRRFAADIALQVIYSFDYCPNLG